MYFVLFMRVGYKYVVRNFLLRKILNFDIYVLEVILLFFFVCLMVNLKGIFDIFLLNLLVVNKILFFYLFFLYMYVFKYKLFGGLRLK